MRSKAKGWLKKNLLWGAGGGGVLVAVISIMFSLDHEPLPQSPLDRSAITRPLPEKNEEIKQHPSPLSPHKSDSIPVERVFPKASILLITVDALRPDHLGIYGYSRNLTPHIDRWAAKSAVFERAYCQVPHTSFSLATLLTGTMLYPLGVKGWEPRPHTLAEIARRYRLKTAAFFPPGIFYIDGDRFAAYETAHFGFEYVKYEHQNAKGRVKQILSFLKKHREQQVLVWTHFFEPHEPYEYHKGFYFGDRAIDRYDSEIAYVDEQIGRLIASFKKSQPESIIVLTADHGEEFGECGNYYHGNTLTEQQIRVPLIVQVPGGQPRRIKKGIAQSVDIPITLLSLLDIPVLATMQGNDLSQWITGDRKTNASAAFVELDRIKALIDGEHKLLCNIEQNTCDLFHLSQAPCSIASNLHQDDIIASRLHKQLLSRMEARVPQWSVAGPFRSCQRLLIRGRQMDVGVIKQLKSECRHSPALRQEAIKVLAGFHSPLALEALSSAMADPDPRVRLQAVAGAALIGDKQALLQAKRLLVQKSLPEDVKRDLLIALLKAGDHTVTPVLADYLSTSKDIYEQIEILRALKDFGDLSAGPALLAKLGNLRSRLAAIEAISEVKLKAAIPQLSQSLLSDRFITWRRAAARALGALGDAKAIPPLTEAIHQEIEPEIVEEALKALHRLKGLPVRGLPEIPKAAWKCAKEQCQLDLKLSCSLYRGGELLVLWDKVRRLKKGKPQMVIHCGLTPINTRTLDSETMMIDLPDRGQGALIFEMGGPPPTLLYATVRFVPRAGRSSANPDTDRFSRSR